MLDNVGLRYPHRASEAPRTLRPLPLLRFAVSATGGAHLCSIQYYLRFWLGICRTSLAVSALRIMRYCLIFCVDYAGTKNRFSGFCLFLLLFTSLSLASTIEITFSSTSRTTAGCRQSLLMALMTDFWSSSIFRWLWSFHHPFCHRGAGIFRARIAVSSVRVPPQAASVSGMTNASTNSKARPKSGSILRIKFLPFTR